MSRSSPLRQFVAKIDPFNSNERELFRSHETVPYLQVKYSDSHWLLNNSVDKLLGDNQQLILVDWEDGRKIKDRHPDEVFRRCVELEEHLSCVYLGDRWTYEAMTSRENRKQINQSIGLQRYLGERFERFDVDFEVNPVLLGWKSWHFERHRDLLEDFGKDLVGFDATGYRSKYKLAEDINHAIDVLGICGIYLSGRIGPTHLAQVPSEVQVFSGKNAILKEIQLENGEFARELLRSSIQRRARQFESPQTEIRQFTTATS